MLAVKAKPLRGRFARLDRSARLRLLAIKALLRKADSRVGFCQQKPWQPKAASDRRCHPEGRSEAKERRRRLITTGRCGPRKMCACLQGGAIFGEDVAPSLEALIRPRFARPPSPASRVVRFAHEP